jgi:hypothetical protein
MIALRTGDRVLVNSNSFLSRAIRFFMRWWAKKYKLSTDYIFSHAGTLILLNEDWYIAESVENGYRIREFLQRYNLNEDMIIVRNKKPYTSNEQDVVINYALYLQEVGNFYQYWAFPQWISLIVFGANIFGKGNKFSTYCYESTYRIAAHVRPEEFNKNPEVITCFDLITDTDEIVYNNHKK